MNRIKYAGALIVFLPSLLTTVWMPALVMAWLAGMLAVFIREVDSGPSGPARMTRTA